MPSTIRKRTAKAYNKKVWLKELQEGDLVLREFLPIYEDAKKKMGA